MRHGEIFSFRRFNQLYRRTIQSTIQIISSALMTFFNLYLPQSKNVFNTVHLLGLLSRKLNVELFFQTDFQMVTRKPLTGKVSIFSKNVIPKECIPTTHCTHNVYKKITMNQWPISVEYDQIINVKVYWVEFAELITLTIKRYKQEEIKQRIIMIQHT